MRHVPPFVELTRESSLELASQREYLQCVKRGWVDFSSHGGPNEMARTWLYRFKPAARGDLPRYLALLVALGREPRQLVHVQGIDFGPEWISELARRAKGGES